MSESTFVEQWLVKRANSADSNSIMSDIQKNESSHQASTTLKNVFWSIVAILNVLILADLLLNSGGNLINFLLLLTGGYRG